MNIHYTKGFREPLRSGGKLHTIRRRAVREGAVLRHIIYPYHRERRECVLENTCTGSQRIRIEVISDVSGTERITVDGRVLTREEADRLVMNDGLGWMEFSLLFNRDFEGYINHWTSLRY